MKKKRMWPAAVLLGLLLAGPAPVTKAAAAVPYLSAAADRGAVQAGGYVTVTITLGNNPSLSTLGMALGYDGSILKYDSTSWSGSLSGDDIKMASDSGSEVSLSIVCADVFSSSGTVATVRFQAVADADSIPVTLSLREMADAQLSAIYDCSVPAAVKTPAAPPQDTEQDDGGTKEPDGASGSRPSEKDPGKDPSGNTADKNTADNKEKDKKEKDDKEKDKNKNPSGTVPDHNQNPSGGSTGSPSANAPVSSTGGTSGAYTQTGQVTVRPQISRAQRSSSGQVQSVSASSKADRNYRTGAGAGNDIFLVTACICGITSLLLLVGKQRGKTE